jgi:DNA-binding transcriptional LysR family regulator
LVVIAAKSHPASRAASLNLSTLKSDKFILREKGSGTRMAVDRHFKKNRFTPTVRMALGSNEAIKEAVAGGLGVSVISSHALGAKPQSQGLAVLNVRGFPLHSQWHLVCPKAKRLSPLALAFQAHLMRDASA